MSDPGLTNRLQQHSRRAGLNVAITMALAIAICVLGFAAIYARLSPMMSDFVGQGNKVAEAPRVAANAPAAATTETSGGQVVATAPTSQPTAPIRTTQATETPGTFEPTHQINSNRFINFRSEPSSSKGSATIIETLPLATPLEYLNEEAPTDDPATDGRRWMKFRLEDGKEGWVREIDVEPYQP